MVNRTKQELYNSLVAKRKAYDFEFLGLLNPSKIANGDFDNHGHLNAWGQWQGNLDADILLIGQDFSDDKYFIENEGMDNPNSATNKKLGTLFREIGIEIGITKTKLYFTNAVLGIKQGGMSAQVKTKWYKNTANPFIKELIDIIQPKIIITLGPVASNTITFIYELPNIKLNREAGNKVDLPANIKFFPVYHPKVWVTNRTLKQQIEDWQKIKPFLLPR